MEASFSAAELTNIWNSYLGNTMAVGVTSYFIGTAKDPDVVMVLQVALDIAVFEVEEARRLLDKYGHPHPEGFSSEDFNFKAPALYNDNIILLVKNILAQNAGTVYSVGLSQSIHPDVRQYFFTILTKTANFLDQITELMVKKGLFNPIIYLPIPGSIEKVHKQSFVGGWLSGSRPLNSEEIMQIVSCFMFIEVEKEFFRSFIQITSSKALKNHFERGEEICKKHLAFFQSLLKEAGLPQQPTWESEITDSTISPFSERLMLFKMSVFASLSFGIYGRAISTMMRKDIGVDITRLMAELGLYGEDTLNLMIELGFLNQLPLAKQ